MNQTISDRLEKMGRGSKTKLAQAVGVSNATVSKWVSDETQPDVFRWPVIEQALGLKEGTLRKASGIERPVTRRVMHVEDVVDLLLAHSSLDRDEALRVVLVAQYEAENRRR